jgi:hypothetical protein
VILIKKKLWFLILMLSTTVLIAGCSNQANLNSRIQSLENENVDLKLKLEQVNSLSMIYQDYEDKQRFVPKESQIYALPIKDFNILRKVEENTIVQVLDAAQCHDQQLWLYVSVPVYDSPINYKGWIQESETIKLTKDNVKQVQGDVFLREGTPVYEVVKYDEISSSASTKISYDIRGRIKNKQGSFVYLMSPGGWYFWVEEKYLIFPTVD